METNIRKCAEADLPAVAALMRELAETAGSTSPLDTASVRRMWMVMEDSPGFYLNLVAEVEGEVVGLATLCFYASFLHRVGTAQINELVVSKTWRGHGIGARLVEACREEALRRGMDELEVATETDNLPARAFYRRVGFTGDYVLLGMDFDPEEADQLFPPA